MTYAKLHWQALIQILKSDYAYFFYPTSNRYLALLCAIFGIPYGLYIRGDEGIFSRFSKFLFKRANSVFTVSEGFTQMVNKVNPLKVGSTIRPMIAYDERDVAIGRTYTSKDILDLLFLSRVTKLKGVEELLRAVKRINYEKQRVRLTIVGDGDYLAEAKRLTNELDIVDSVVFTGAVNDKVVKSQFYLDSDIYVLPTYYPEGFPRTLYEAMIFGTPIITTFVAGIPGLMVDGINCKRVETRSVDDLVNCISFALENYSVMVDYARNATKTVLPIIDSHRPSHAQDVDKAIKRIKK